VSSFTPTQKKTGSGSGTDVEWSNDSGTESFNLYITATLRDLLRATTQQHHVAEAAEGYHYYFS